MTANDHQALKPLAGQTAQPLELDEAPKNLEAEDSGRKSCGTCKICLAIFCCVIVIGGIVVAAMKPWCGPTNCLDEPAYHMSEFI